MVELDVQLSKDLVPVIYHDYYIYISMKKVYKILLIFCYYLFSIVCYLIFVYWIIAV